MRVQTKKTRCHTSTSPFPTADPPVSSAFDIGLLTRDLSVLAEDHSEFHLTTQPYQQYILGGRGWWWGWLFSPHHPP